MELHNKAIEESYEIFKQKYYEYGNSLSLMRQSSIIDLILIKALRIRSIEEKKENIVGEDVSLDYKAIINYSILALIIHNNGAEYDLLNKYSNVVAVAKEILLKKNSDYSDAWKYIDIETITDIIIMKVMRIKNILKTQGMCTDQCIDNYIDIINYATFAISKLK